MKFAQPSHGLRAAINSRAASRTQTGERIRFETHGRQIARQPQRTLHIRLHIVEIERLPRTAPLLRPPRARRDSGKRFDLLELAPWPPAPQSQLRADFEHPNPPLPAPPILAARLNHTDPN